MREKAWFIIGRKIRTATCALFWGLVFLRAGRTDSPLDGKEDYWVFVFESTDCHGLNAQATATAYEG